MEDLESLQKRINRLEWWLTGVIFAMVFGWIMLAITFICIPTKMTTDELRMQLFLMDLERLQSQPRRALPPPEDAL